MHDLCPTKWSQNRSLVSLHELPGDAHTSQVQAGPTAVDLQA